MKRIFLVAFFVFSGIGGFGAVVDLPELPKTPVSQLGMGQLSEVLSANSAESWNSIATSSRDKAIELAQSGNIEQAANWLYTSLAATLCAKEGVDMPVELKRIILENIPAFFDFYESVAEHDSLSNACSILTQIFLNQPAQVKKYLRAAMALGLIYDTAFYTRNVGKERATFEQALIFFDPLYKHVRIERKDHQIRLADHPRIKHGRALVYDLLL